MKKVMTARGDALDTTCSRAYNSALPTVWISPSSGVHAAATGFSSTTKQIPTPHLRRAGCEVNLPPLPSPK